MALVTIIWHIGERENSILRTAIPWSTKSWSYLWHVPEPKACHYIASQWCTLPQVTPYNFWTWTDHGAIHNLITTSNVVMSWVERSNYVHHVQFCSSETLMCISLPDPIITSTGKGNWQGSLTWNSHKGLEFVLTCASSVPCQNACHIRIPKNSECGSWDVF